jgi:translin
MRQHRLDRAEEILQQMEEIHRTLTLFDFPDALTGGLRRTNDMVRGVLERTRGDLTMALRQKELEEALRGLEEKLDRGDS